MKRIERRTFLGGAVTLGGDRLGKEGAFARRLQLAQSSRATNARPNIKWRFFVVAG